MNKKFWIAAGAILVALVLVCAVSAAMLLHLPPPTINDETSAAEQEGDMAVGEDDQGSGDGGKGENQIVISSSVQLIVDEDADQINKAIRSVQAVDESLLKIELSKDSTGLLSGRGKGDIFLLDGDESTPLQGPYAGKVVSSDTAADGTVTVIVESPGMDEVFDSIDIDIEEAITEENIASVSALEGVKVSYVDDVEEAMDVAPMAAEPAEEGVEKPVVDTMRFSSSETVQISNLSSSGSGEKKEDKNSENIDEDPYVDGGLLAKDGLFLEVDVDLLETMKGIDKLIDKIEREDSVEVVPNTEADLSEKRDKENESTAEKLNNDLIDSINSSPELRLQGKYGLSDLNLNCDVDWDVWDTFSKPGGFTTLHVKAEYNMICDTKLELKVKELSLQGDPTKYKVADFLTMQGLREKRFPILTLRILPTGVSLVQALPGNGMNQEIKRLTEKMPVSVFLMLYMDATGKISASVTYEMNYREHGLKDMELVKDGKLTMNLKDEVYNRDMHWDFNAVFKTDMDTHFGFSANLYIMNVCVLDVSIVKFGAELQGEAGLHYGSATGGKVETYADMYVRLYLKLCDVYIGGKIVFHFPKTQEHFEIDEHFLLADISLLELGKTRETHFDSESMSWGRVSAQDEEYIYYLNEHGEIIKQNKMTGQSRILCDTGVTQFCGMDETYLYILRPSTTKDSYNICRIDKNGGVKRDIETKVEAVLNFDDNYIYYLKVGEEKEIRALERDTLHSKTFCTFRDNVQIMEAYGDFFFVSTLDQDDIFSMLFGADAVHYKLDAKGNIVRELGSSPSPLELAKDEYSDYYSAALYHERKILRPAASNVYWISHDLQTYVDLEQSSGWNQKDAGVFVTLNSEDGSDGEYTIWLYRAEDAQRVKVADVESDQAFFTLCQDVVGNWYFFDESDTEMILYKMDRNFENLTVEHTYGLDVLDVSLETCSMEIVGNEMIFYSIAGEDLNSSASVLYRYDLY